MNDDDKRAKSAFNTAAPKTQNVRDKDNAGKEFDPPSNEIRPRPNLAPAGMNGIKTKETQQQAYDVELEFDPLIEKSQMTWHEVIDGNFDTSENLKGYSFELTLSENDDAQTIEGSSIKQLDLKKDGLIVSRFDNGWQHESHLPEAREAVDQLKEQFPERQREFKSFADMNPDIDNDIDL